MNFESQSFETASPIDISIPDSPTTSFTDSHSPYSELPTLLTDYPVMTPTTIIIDATFTTPTLITDSPISTPPTDSPITTPPTDSPITTPTDSPITTPPTDSPITTPPTDSPITTPTDSPITTPPTDSPIPHNAPPLSSLMIMPISETPPPLKRTRKTINNTELLERAEAINQSIAERSNTTHISLLMAVFAKDLESFGTEETRRIALKQIYDICYAHTMHDIASL